MTTARHIETDTADATRRDWYEIDGETYAITGANQILDADGHPLTEGDAQTQRVRRAIEAAR